MRFGFSVTAMQLLIGYCWLAVIVHWVSALGLFFGWGKPADAKRGHAIWNAALAAMLLFLLLVR